MNLFLTKGSFSWLVVTFSNQMHLGKYRLLSVPFFVAFLCTFDFHKLKQIVPQIQLINLLYEQVILLKTFMYCMLEFVANIFPGIVIAEEPEWKDCIQGSTAVVNLAGMPISTRWSSEVSSARSHGCW